MHGLFLYALKASWGTPYFQGLYKKTSGMKWFTSTILIITTILSENIRKPRLKETNVLKKVHHKLTKKEGQEVFLITTILLSTSEC